MCLYFCICKMLVFPRCGSFVISMQNNVFIRKALSRCSKRVFTTCLLWRIKQSYLLENRRGGKSSQFFCFLSISLYSTLTLIKKKYVGFQQQKVKLKKLEQQKNEDNMLHPSSPYHRYKKNNYKIIF